VIKYDKQRILVLLTLHRSIEKNTAKIYNLSILPYRFILALF